METILKILDIVGYISTILLILTITAAIWAWFRGILPSVLRLGVSLSKRKIAIVAKAGNATSLSSLLVQSKIFRNGNILAVNSINDLGMLEEASIILVHWSDFKDNYQAILNKKRDSDALIVYAPQDEGRVPDEVINELSKHRNVTINNFRGRLINDVFVSMITSGYGQN